MIKALLLQTLRDWFRHRCISKGAALAFYALFSLAPMLVLVIAVAGLFFGAEAAQGEILRQLEGLIGHDGAAAVQAMIRGASDPAAGGLASVVALATLFLGSTTAFAELKQSLDEIWFGHAVPDSGVMLAIRTRLLSFGLVMVLAFLLLVSLAINATLSLLSGYLGLTAGGSAAAALASSLVTFLVISGRFAAIFKLLPPVKLDWHDVLLGAMITAALFEIGKYFIGLYLGNAAVVSSFGAAGSLVVLAMWVYFSAQIFFFGAELTRLYAHRHGSLRKPATRHARRVSNPPVDGEGGKFSNPTSRSEAS